MTEPIADANATFCATLVDEWLRCGVEHAVVAPGSRSTPLALALAGSSVTVHVVHDERVAAFMALGLGVATQRPAVLLCTSGTAAVNFHPAVVEAGLSGVPMLVTTADRPPELRGVGAPQTIDQLELYRRSVRWFHDADPPDTSDPVSWRPLAQRAFSAAETGPVHLNLPFREPLVGEATALPEPIGPPLPIPRTTIVGGPVPDEFHELQRGVIVAGGCSGIDPVEVAELAERLGWPILADPQSGLRSHAHAIPAFDPLLRSEPFAAAHKPQIVIRFGRAPASKVLSQWTSDVPVLQVGGPGIVNPEGNVVRHCAIADLEPLAGAAKTPWLARWRRASQRAETIIDARVDCGELTEPTVARIVAEQSASDDAVLVVSSSMPVRDLEWYGGSEACAHSNRGANGIDGVMSTAVGVGLAGRSVTVLIGDIAFIHDSNALVSVRQRGIDLRVVVIDNRGGGIFSFLPQSTLLDTDRFEQLFGTPHDTDVAALARAHGVDCIDVENADELRAALRNRGVSVIRVRTDRAGNVDIHRQLNDEIAAAL